MSLPTSNAIVLSAGGTGGHLFPAQALAAELVKRGRQIVVMTDARFAHYATHFPGATIQTVPSSFAIALAGIRLSRRYWPRRRHLLPVRQRAFRLAGLGRTVESRSTQ